MKKLILSVVFVSIYTFVFGQFSIKAGAGLSTILQEGEKIDRNDIENKSIVTPALGVALDLNISDLFTIQPELLYSQSGGKNTYDLLDANIENTYRIDFIELPILAKLRIGSADQEGLGFYVAAGPWLGYALRGKYKSRTSIGDNNVIEVNEDFTFDDQDNLQRLNYGILGGLGVTYGSVFFDARYNYGINNLNDKDADNNNDNKPVFQTRGVVLSLGYKF